ncbi:MAG: MoaD/ThiS family protein [Actinobacteria bacterium]|nr:MoaD/ThiS family protein [Actinomycetota bacterium]
MTVKVKIPTQLRQLVGGEKEIEIEKAANVREILDNLGGQHPGLIERIVDENGEIRRFVNLYVGDEDVRFLQGLDTPVEPDQTVSILPAVAGG